jgi:hypothetical protein
VGKQDAFVWGARVTTGGRPPSPRTCTGGTGGCTGTLEWRRSHRGYVAAQLGHTISPLTGLSGSSLLNATALPVSPKMATDVHVLRETACTPPCFSRCPVFTAGMSHPDGPQEPARRTALGDSLLA